MLSSNLTKSIELLKNSLEETPDSWFKRPEGILLKPDFKRPQQNRIGGSGIISGIFHGSGFNKRYFRLNGTILSYYKDQTTLDKVSGDIDLEEIEEIRRSTIEDAIKIGHAFDLVSPNTIYTLCATNEIDMLKWILSIFQAINGIFIPMRSSDLNGMDQNNINTPLVDGDWQRYNYTFDLPKKSLLMNIKGLPNRHPITNIVTNHWIVVSGFERKEINIKGPAEASNRIKELDLLIGVNSTDISSCTFNEAMEVLKNAEWPMTLHFLRDLTTCPSDFFQEEGWGRLQLIFGQNGDDITSRFTEFNKRYSTSGLIAHKRYFKLDDGKLTYSRPLPGGFPNTKPDGFINLDHIEYLQPYFDPFSKDNHKFILQLKRKENIDNINNNDNEKKNNDNNTDNEDDESIIISNNEVFPTSWLLYFQTERELNSWKDILCKSRKNNLLTHDLLPVPDSLSSPSSIHTSLLVEHEILENEFLLRDDLRTNEIKDELNDQFINDNDSFIWTERIFRLRFGVLTWQKIDSFSSKDIDGTLVLITSDTCNLQIVKGYYLTTENEYHIYLKTDVASFVISNKNEDIIQKWLNILSELVIKTNRIEVVDKNIQQVETIPNECESYININRSASVRYQMKFGRNSILDKKSKLEEENYNLSQEKRDILLGLDKYEGWMAKKGIKKVGFGSTAFKARYFILDNEKLNYFKTENQTKETGTILLNNIINIRLSDDPLAPEYAIDIITSERVYVLVPETKNKQGEWLFLLKRRTNLINENNNNNNNHNTMNISTIKPSFSNNELKNDKINIINGINHDNDIGDNMNENNNENNNEINDKNDNIDITSSVNDELIKGGSLSKKTMNRLTKFFTWKSRFFALTTRSLSYYETEADYYNNIEALGSINLLALLSISTSNDPKPKPGHAIDLKVAVTQGGDSNGERIYTLETRDRNTAKEWMDAIAKATNRFGMRVGPGNIYESYITEKSDQNRLYKRLNLKNKVTSRENLLNRNPSNKTKLRGPGSRRNVLGFKKKK